MSEPFGPNADASGARDPAAIFWHGMPRSHILRSEEFRRLGETHILATLWGGSWKDRLSEEAKAAGTTRDAIYAGAVEICDLVEVQQDPCAIAVPERVHPFNERGDAILDDQAPLEVQDHDAANFTLGNLHAPIAATILTSPTDRKSVV